MPKRASNALLIPTLFAAFASAHGQTAAGWGAWEGLIAGQRVRVTIDSGAAGWGGTLFAPSFGRDTLRFVTTTVRGDSVMLKLPEQGRNAVLSGAISRDRQRFGGVAIVAGDTAGLFRLARAGTPAAARLLATLVRQPAQRRSYDHPDSARLITSDIALFWNVIDNAPADSLEDWLARDYIEKGSPGLRDFIPGRILSAADLAFVFERRRGDYTAARLNTLRVAEAEPGIRKAYRALKALYPETTFPDVYFIIGRFNSGGTASDNGILIGAEMYIDPKRLPEIVAHEMIHFQQAPLRNPRTLLQQSFREGAANFIGEMISGGHINNESHRYGLANERVLWSEFKTRMQDTNYAGWLYGDPPGERPADLGYFMGYRLAQAYYEKAPDKRAALRDIIRGADVERIVAQSGYDPQ